MPQKTARAFGSKQAPRRRTPARPWDGASALPYGRRTWNNTTARIIFAVKGTATVTTSSDATLSALALEDASDDSAIAINPVFASGTTSYTASVLNGVDEITIAPTVNESHATVKYLDSSDTEIADANSGKTGQQVSLDEGANTIKVKVKAQDVTTTNTYTVVVTRAAAAMSSAVVLISNIAQLPGTPISSTRATSFTTGHNRGGYLLSSVDIYTGVPSSNVTPRVEIYENSAANRPGTLLVTLTGPGTIAAGNTDDSHTFNDTSDTMLETNSRYWLVVTNDSEDDGRGFTVRTAAGGTVDPGLPEWYIETTYAKADIRTSAWVESLFRTIFAIKGTVLSAATNTAPVFADDTASRSFTESEGDNPSGPDEVGAVVTATDADGDPLTYSLEGTDAAKFGIDSSSGQILLEFGLNYDREAKASYSVTVKADDRNGGTDTIAVTIDVDNAVEKPYSLGIHSAGHHRMPTVTATSGSTTSLDVSWMAPPNIGRPAITGYKVEYRAGVSGSWINHPHTGTGTTATIASLTAATSYQVKVLAANSDGDGPFSSPGAGTTGTPTNTAATGAPTITGTAQVGETLTAVTTGITDADGLTSPTYTYQWIRANGTEADIASANSSTYILVAADLGKTIKVKVSFTDDASHAETLTSAATATVVAAPTAPTVDDVDVTSTPASGDTYGTGEMIRFTVTFDQAVTVTGTPEFEFCLGTSATVSCSVGSPPPALRSAALLSGTGTTALVFSYTVLVGDVDDNGIYAGNQNETIKLDGGDTIQGTVGGLTAVLTHDAVGTPTGHKVNGAAANTPPTAANNTVTTAEDRPYAFTAADFGFMDADAGAALASVKIESLPAVGTLALDGTDVTLNKVVTKADIDDDKLTFTPVAGASGTGYATFTFKVNDGTDDSASAYTMTIDVTATTTANTAPGAPTGLTATANGPSRIDLAWAAPASIGSSAITGYRIEVSPDGSSWSDLVANTGSTATTYAHMGLNAGATRHYRVSAINAAGTSDPSGSDEATTETAQAQTAVLVSNVGQSEDDGFGLDDQRSCPVIHDRRQRHRLHPDQYRASPQRLWQSINSCGEALQGVRRRNGGGHVDRPANVGCKHEKRLCVQAVFNRHSSYVNHLLGRGRGRCLLGIYYLHQRGRNPRHGLGNRQ